MTINKILALAAATCFVLTALSIAALTPWGLAALAASFVV